jgi:hypothetical protein
MTRKILSIAAIAIIFFVSCKKDSSSSSSSDPLTGTWSFVGMNVQTQVTDNYSDAGTAYKDVSTSNYQAANPAGTVVFSGGTATSTGIAYSVSTTVYDQSYEDNVLIDTFSEPFTFSIQPTSSSSKYQIIGTDSVFFPGGAFISSSSLAGGTQQTVASGYKFHISGDMLTMTSVYAADSTVNSSGLLEQLNEQANYSVTLKKQ